MVSSSASASPTFSAAAGPQELGRAQPDTLLAPPGGARPGRTRAARGDRSGWRHTRPCRRAGRDRRRPATRVCARRAGPPTRRPVTCERAYAAEPRRSSSEVDDLRRPTLSRRSRPLRTPLIGCVCNVFTPSGARDLRLPLWPKTRDPRDLSTRLRQSGLGRAGSAPKPRATPGRVGAAPPSAPPFELLESKLLPPQGPSGTVSRGELISSLEGSRAPPLVLLSAGPGWGKTTLLAQWASRSQRPFAWVSVDERDNDPIVLLTYVAVALDRVSRLDPSVFDALALAGVSVEATVVPRLGAALAKMSEQVVLVLDDLHLLDNPASLDAIEALTRHVSEGSQMALSARGRAGAPAGSVAGAWPGAGDRAGRPAHGRSGGAPAAERGRRGPAGCRRRRAHRAHRGLARRPLPRRAVDQGPGTQGQGRGDVLGERPARVRLPEVGVARPPGCGRSSLPHAYRRSRADVRAALR